MLSEFQKYAVKHRGISSLRLEQYQSIAKNYLTRLTSLKSVR